MSRLAKQIIYSAIYLFIFALIVLWGYFKFRPAPSCFDNKQNQGEEGIDCGGPCAKLCVAPDTKPIEVADQVRIFYPSRTSLSLLGKIQNPNQKNAALNLDYEFRLYDNSGNILKAFPGKSFIYAGDIKYLAVYNLPISDYSQVSRADLLVSNPEWIPAERFSKPKIVVRDQETNPALTGLSVTGTLVNRDTLSFSKLTIMAIFYGQLGQAAGVSQTEIENLVPGEARNFTILNPAISNIDPDRTQVLIFARRQTL